jgi:hypothetical protein
VKFHSKTKEAEGMFSQKRRAVKKTKTLESKSEKKYSRNEELKESPSDSDKRHPQMK